MRRMTCAIGGLMLLCTVALAEQRDGFQLGPNLGYTFGGGVDTPSLTYGLQASYQFKYFKVELAYDRLKDESSETEEGITASGDLKVHALSLSGWGRLPITDNFGVYAGGGVGYYMPSMTLDMTADESSAAGVQVNADVDIKNAFGLHLGIGADYAITDHLVLFADIRKVWVKFDTDVTASATLGGRSVSATDSDKVEWYFTMVRLGLNYKF